MYDIMGMSNLYITAWNQKSFGIKCCPKFRACLVIILVVSLNLRLYLTIPPLHHLKLDDRRTVRLRNMCAIE